MKIHPKFCLATVHWAIFLSGSYEYLGRDGARGLKRMASDLVLHDRVLTGCSRSRP